MLNQPQKRQLGPLHAYEISCGDASAPYIILFHGYGANAFDLLPLSQMMLIDRQVNWLFPDGLLDVDIGFGMTGKAWFPIDLAAFDRAMQTGELPDLSKTLPVGFESARDAGLELLAALGIEAERTILGGFSQGAMLATGMSLELQANPAAVLILSGALLDAESWSHKARRRAGLPFFQSHGTADPLLPYSLAQKLYEMLRTAGWEGEFHAFTGGHEIPQDVLVKLNQFLEARVG